MTSLSKRITVEGHPLFSTKTQNQEIVIRNRQLQGTSERASAAHGAHNPCVSSWCLPTMNTSQRSADSEDFHAKLAQLEKEAYEKGFEQGQKDGFALEQRKIEEMGRELEDLFTKLNNLKTEIYQQSEGELLQLSMIIAKKIIGEEVKTNRGIIANTICSAMKFLTDKHKLKIIINPDDMEDVRKLLPHLAKMSKGGEFHLVEDHVVEKGGCILETGFGKVNATIDDQLTILEEEIERQFQTHRGIA